MKGSGSAAASMDEGFSAAGGQGEMAGNQIAPIHSAMVIRKAETEAIAATSCTKSVMSSSVFRLCFLYVLFLFTRQLRNPHAPDIAAVPARQG